MNYQLAGSWWRRLVAAMAGGFILSFTVTTVTCLVSDRACRVLCAPAAGTKNGIGVVALTVLYLMVPFTVAMWVVLKKIERQ